MIPKPSVEPSIAALDFAAKHSACCVIDMAGTVLDEFSSALKSDTEFLGQVDWAASQPHHFGGKWYEPSVLLIEDLPIGVKYMGVVKQVCQLQGRLIDRLDRSGSLGKLVFVPPATWQRTFPGVWRQGPEAVLPVAKELFDYDPPDTGWQRLHHAERRIAKKSLTDFAAAFLIARWGLAEWETNETFDAPTTLRYVA